MMLGHLRQEGVALSQEDVSLSREHVSLHLQTDSTAQLMKKSANLRRSLGVNTCQFLDLVGEIMTDGQHAQTVLVEELEAGILGLDLFPEPPDPEILDVLHDIVEEDHSPIAQLGSACLVIVTDGLVGVIAVDVEKIDLTVLEAWGGLIEGHLQQA